MKKNTKYLIVAVLALLLASMSCKPTENNYRTAYNAATQNRGKQKDLDRDLGIPDGGLLNEEGPQKVQLDSVSVKVGREFLSVVGDDRHVDKKEEFPPYPKFVQRYVVVVAKYKMSTNAHAQSGDLRRRGLESVVMKNREGDYYVTCGSGKDFTEAVGIKNDFENRHKTYNYVGLEGSPVIIEVGNIGAGGLRISL